MINTFSKFYYGYTITEDNYLLDFSEGGGELTAELAIGSYTPTEFSVVVKTALDTAGEFTYFVTFDRATRKFEIEAEDTFSLLLSSGSHAEDGPWELMGFTGSDRSGFSHYTGDSASGSVWAPQFKLQDYVPSSDLQQAVDATINKSASGRVEVVKFGTEKFIEMNVRFITDIAQDGTVLKTDESGVANARSFLQFAVTKSPFEFMPDVSDANTYETVILESTPESATGVGYRLREMYDKGLPGYYETGKLKLRVLEV